MRWRAVVCAAALFLAGCGPTTFIVSKDGRAYYLGRQSEILYEMLCKSGDLDNILTETSMPADLKKDLFRYVCGEERSREKVIAVYQYLTPAEKEDFQRVFRSYGYTINYVPC